ncbi:Tetratricopeptide repeat protein [uncultured archaeon]|nr:Tetratricopeptide repeat protein [uncultured archaeon]
MGLEIDEELKDIRGKAARLNNIGSVYRDLGKPEQALEYYQKALEIDEELKDVRNAEIVKKNIEKIHLKKKSGNKRNYNLP